jgi:hypothetical protein
MASWVQSRQNHYEVLGLSPKASQEEIGQAFAKAMGMFATRPLGAAAQIGAAFEVLRDPARRSAYDRAMGLVAEPQLHQWRVAAGPTGPGVIGSAWGELAQRVTGDGPPSLPKAESAPPPEAPSEPKIAHFIASSLRERSAPVPRIEQNVEPPAEQEDRPFEWKRPALAIGSLIVAAGLIGTLAGLSVRDGDDAVQPQPGVIAPTPAVKPHAVTPAPSPAPTAAPIEVPAARPPHVAAMVHARRPAPAQHPIAIIDPVEPAVSTQTPGSPVEVASDKPETETPAVVTAAVAAMPLPNRVIAHTIERIGYACGEVASTDPVAGAAGVFKVTCSSGQAYEASPVHGRYRFRRLGSR